MPPFSTTTPQPLPHQDFILPQEALFIQFKMSPKVSSLNPTKYKELPLILYLKNQVMSIKIHIFQIMYRLMKRMSGFFGSLIYCVGRKVAMMRIERSNIEALERAEDLEMKESLMNAMMECKEEALVTDCREGEQFTPRSMRMEISEEGLVELEEEVEDYKETNAPQMKTSMEINEESSIVGWEEDREEDLESEEENDDDDDDDDDDDNKEEDEDCEPDDLDSDWSDNDEGDSEGSAESLELWESFMNTNDPYNPLSFCSPISSRTKANQEPVKTQPIQTFSTADLKSEEAKVTPDPEKKKKVCFSDEVIVRPLLVWGFASRAARDGSCWLQAARDRDRFKKRVKEMETLLNPCLMPSHRDRIWRTWHNQQLPAVSSSASL